MTPAERALLLAVAKAVRSQYLGYPPMFDILSDLIAAVEAEAEKPSEPVKTCETCLCWPDMPRAAPCHLCVEFSMRQPRQPDRDDDISRVYEEEKM